MITLFLSMAVLFLCQTGLASPFFNARLEFKAGDGPCSVAIDDLDGDGGLDLAVANDGSHTVSVLINSLFIVEVIHPKDWIMISLPVDPPDKRLNKLFPDAVVFYGYEQGIGYVRVKPDEDLEVGRGYTRPVSSDGWAMIGGCTDPARVIPHGCDIGVIYGYVQGIGYQRVLASQSLEPGKGYS